MKRREFLQLAAGTTAFSIVGQGSALAQAWPSRPVKLIVSFPAGGATDLVARPWADALSKAFGQQFVVENRGGASGLIGNEAGFRSAPDGHTFLFTGNTGTVGLPILRKHNFDPRQFLIAAHTGNAVSGFTIHPSVGVKTFAEFIAYAKKNPGKLNFGSSGAGTQPHLRYEMLKFKTGVDIAHIPYRGGSDSLNDLLAGNIQLMNEASTLAHVKAGKLIMLCVNAPQRFADLPDVPTLTECGVKDADMASWFGMYAPPGTPKEILAKLNEKANEISKTPEWKAKMALVACIPQTGTLDELQKLWDDDWKSTAQVIKTAGIKLE
ncbi:MAG: tripartite tricarboxylate transporter substrate binding protein [Hyphomicrobiaceae bacterium]|nr:tripartite tricarboxylate transporter substrate binding protein [Hyphomicrobiaceae bacterium]